MSQALQFEMKDRVLLWNHRARVGLPKASEGIEAVKQGIKIQKDLDEVYEWVTLARNLDQRVGDLHPDQDQVVLDGGKNGCGALLEGETLTYSLQGDKMSLKVERDHREVCSASATRGLHRWDRTPIYQIHAQTPQGTYYIYQLHDSAVSYTAEDLGFLTFTPPE